MHTPDQRKRIYEAIAKFEGCLWRVKQRTANDVAEARQIDQEIEILSKQLERLRGML